MIRSVTSAELAKVQQQQMRSSVLGRAYLGRRRWDAAAVTAQYEALIQAFNKQIFHLFCACNDSHRKVLKEREEMLPSRARSVRHSLGAT